MNDGRVQAELIRSWRPWEKSTGARTPEGKARSSQNRALSLERARLEVRLAQEALQSAKQRLHRVTAGADADTPTACQNAPESTNDRRVVWFASMQN